MKADYFRKACCFPLATMIHDWSVNQFAALKPEVIICTVASENKVGGDALRDAAYL